ncbi:MAG: polysaccharide deacetylase family protein [Streptosporangiaceae bacterium]
MSVIGKSYGPLEAGSDGTARPSMGVPAVAMYHSVSPYEQDPYLVTVTPQRFERQMQWLRRRGLRGVSVSDLLAARREGAGRGLMGLTFDDGYADFIEYALPILTRYGFGGTVFPIAGRLGGQNEWDVLGPRKPLMSADQVRRAADAGIEIGSHGLRHASLRGMAAADLIAEAEESRAILTETIGREISGFCYPYGHLDETAVTAVQQAGYSYGCAIWRSPSTGPHALPRVYVGNADGSLRLWAKSARRWLTWDYRGPGAARLGRLAGTGPATSQDAATAGGLQQLT